MKKFVVYTCICGGYDALQQPYMVPDDFDFILFVPKGIKKSESTGAWKIEELPVSWESPITTSRFPKMCPHSLLEDYEYSLWIDGNIGIASEDVYDKCRELAKRGVQYAGLCHPERDCVYEECEMVLKGCRENLHNLLHVVKFLTSNGLERHEGLMENGVIFRRHNDEAVVAFDRYWWEMFLKHSPKRDQLVHTLCLKETPAMTYEYFLPKGESMRNSALFNYVMHYPPAPSWFQKKLNGPKRFILKKYIQLSLKHLNRAS